MLIWFFLFLGLGVPMGQAAVINSADRLECNARDLELKSCSLKIKDLKITLGPTKITWLHGTWRSIADVPDQKAISSWESVRVMELESRYFLELKFWKTVSQELTVERLDWVMIEIHQKEFHERFTKSIGKRKPAPEIKGKFITDQMLESKIFVNKGKKVEWSTGVEQGVLE